MHLSLTHRKHSQLCSFVVIMRWNQNSLLAKPKKDVTDFNGCQIMSHLQRQMIIEKKTLIQPPPWHHKAFETSIKHIRTFLILCLWPMMLRNGKLWLFLSKITCSSCRVR